MDRLGAGVLNLRELEGKPDPFGALLGSIMVVNAVTWHGLSSFGLGFPKQGSRLDVHGVAV